MRNRRRLTINYTVEDLHQLWDAQPYAAATPQVDVSRQFPAIADPFLQTAGQVYYVHHVPQKKLVLVSANTQELLGYPAESIQRHGARFIFDMMDAEDRPKVLQIVYRSYLHMKNFTPDARLACRVAVPFRMVKSNGQTTWVLHYTLPIILDENGAVIYTFNILLDITAFKHDTRINGVISYPTPEGLNNIYLEPDDPYSQPLTPREQQIVQMLIEGLSSKEIAQSLNISTFTVNNHRKRLLEKTGCRNSPELVRFAMEHGLT